MNELECPKSWEYGIIKNLNLVDKEYCDSFNQSKGCKFRPKCAIYRELFNEHHNSLLRGV